MGQCVEKRPHSCGTRDGLQTFEQEDGKLTGYCFSCSTFVPNPYGEEKTIDDIPAKRRLTKTKGEIRQELEEISNYPVEDLKDRRLRKDVLDQYGIKLGFDEETGTKVKLHYYPYRKNGKLTAYKVRLVEGKRMWSVGDQRDVDLFGFDEAIATGAKRLIITEGELDAVALTRILQMHTPEKYKDYIPAVCSLPHGASSAGKDLARLAGEIRKHFKEVSFAFDDDAAGEKAVEEACKVFPEATVISLPAKDANDCIIHGKTKAAHKAVSFNAHKPKNTRLVLGDTLHETAREAAQWGYSWPWQHINETTRGIRKGETVYIGSGVKMGKSEMVNALAAHCIKEHGWKVFMAKPEEANNKTYKLLASKMVGKIFHDPSVEFDYEAYDRAGEMLAGKVVMLDIYQNITWDTLKGDIRAAAHEGCEAVFLDPITNLTNGMNAADANVKLQEIAQELATIAKDLDIVIFIFCHLKAPENGAPHERGGRVYSSQFAGSRAMMRSCNLMIGIEGNKDPELPFEERNVRILEILEDREFGNTGRFPLYWDSKTSFFNEM
tara:strand:- start:38268 stop:39920 length:1653 start_codon:yes stop_codon:yes gene_type:complete